MKFAPLSAAALAILTLSACSGSGDSNTSNPASGKLAAVPPPAGTEWSQKVEATEFGVRMGNPDAPIKVIEYGSYTCPHCRDFQAEAHEAIEKDYVNSGRVSFEYRNMVRDGLDLSAALIAHCAGPEAFFPLNTQIFANQEDMINQYISHSQAEQEAAGSAPPDQRFIRMARLGNLIEFAKQRGISEDQARTCLADPAAAQKIARNNEEAAKIQIQGTPSFILNGTLLDNTATWSALETRLRDAGA